MAVNIRQSQQPHQVISIVPMTSRKPLSVNGLPSTHRECLDLVTPGHAFWISFTLMRNNPQISKLFYGVLPVHAPAGCSKSSQGGIAGIVQSVSEKQRSQRPSSARQTKPRAAAQSRAAKNAKPKSQNESGSVRSVWTGSFQNPNRICQEERPEASAPIPETRPKISSPIRTLRGYPGMTLPSPQSKPKRKCRGKKGPPR